MSDLISRIKLLEEIKCYQMDIVSKATAMKVIRNAPAVTDTNVGSKWIPCSERLPEERESIFKKAKGTDKWSPAMFEGISDNVNVTVEFEDGTRTTKTSHTLDGKWKCEKEYGIKMKVIAWQPLPEPYKGE